MSVAERRRQGTASTTDSLSNLSINAKKKKTPATVADSWEDEAENAAEGDAADDASEDSSGPNTPIAPTASPHPAAPPPTPSSPNAAFNGSGYALPTEFPSMMGMASREYGMTSPREFGLANNGEYGMIGPHKEYGMANHGDSAKRPDKTTAAASRMIAGALGVRAPRKDEEMKRFEKAANDKERIRRDREREEKEEGERRKRAVWEE